MSWANHNFKISYPWCVAHFDQMLVEEVPWIMYNLEAVAEHPPQGLSSLCPRDHRYWMTRSLLMFNIFVESYCIDRVMR
jgi:hypothetical protein